MRAVEPTRRSFLKRMTAACGMFWLGPGDAAALDDSGCRDDFAGRTIRWIVPQAPGGGYDAYSRLIAPFYADKLSAEAVVENIVGAGGSVGANVLKHARPDGTTVGLMNASGIVVASMLGDANTPSPVTDFAILGRVARTPQIWASGKGSGLLNMYDVLTVARRRPLLFGIQDVGSTNFAGISVGSFLMGLDYEVVAGYPGTAAAVMAALRGEVDLIGFTFESVLNWIDAGDLKPVLQLSDAPISPQPSLEGVSLLGGPNGLAERRARELGQDTDQARDDAGALASVLNLGRVVVAPAGLEPGVFECLEATLYETLTDPDLEKAAAQANWTLDVARAEVTMNNLRQGAENATRFIPLLRRAIRRVQG